jgi:hypothetical protein
MPAITRFEIDFTPDAGKLAMGFVDWGVLLGDLRPVFSDVLELLENHSERHFDSEGTQTGARFAKLSKPYREWKEFNFPGLPILTLRGVLRGSLNSQRGRGSIRRITKSAVIYGTKVKYARKQQAAGRPPLRFNANVRDKSSLSFAMSQLFQAHIVHARKKAMGTLPVSFVSSETERLDSQRENIIRRRTT